MDQEHPIPRQITTFEFKLIGFLTLRQFLYLLISVPTGFVIYKIFPIPLLNIVLAALCVGFGAALAFLPINDRPMEVWVKNLIRRLNSPTQYTYVKQNSPLYFLRHLYFVSDPHRVMAHVESQEKLTAYLAATKKQQTADSVAQRQRVQALLRNKQTASAQAVQTVPVVPVAVAKMPPKTSDTNQAPTAVAPQTSMAHPIFSGVVKNHKQIPLPGIMIYVRDEKNNLLRLLKTNLHGVFASFNPLASGIYVFQLKDTNGMYFFDTMKIDITPETSEHPIVIFSKEML